MFPAPHLCRRTPDARRPNDDGAAHWEDDPTERHGARRACGWDAHRSRRVVTLRRGPDVRPQSPIRVYSTVAGRLQVAKTGALAAPSWNTLT